jgi:formiminotetrahydrofolate cyclodeaminase
MMRLVPFFMRMKAIAPLLVFALLLSACGVFQPSKSAMKAGIAYENQDMLDEASESLFRACGGDPTLVEAQAAYKRVGTKWLDRSIQTMRTQYEAQNYEGVLKTRAAVQVYQDKAASVNVRLNLTDTQTEAIAYAMCGSAEAFFTEAQNLYGQLKYRKAYQRAARTETICKATFDKPDLQALMQNCIQNGKVTAGWIPFRNATRQVGVNEEIQALVQQKFQNANDPMLEILTADQVAIQLSNKNLEAANLDIGRLAKVGKELGIQYLIVCNLISYTEEGGQITRVNKTAYKRRAYKEDGKDKVAYDIPATYQECRGAKSYKMALQYQLLSPRDGKIAQSDIINFTHRDEVHFFTYNGNYNDLSLTQSAAPAQGGGLLGAIVGAVASGLSATGKERFTARQDFEDPTSIRSRGTADISGSLYTKVYGYFDNM